MVERLSVREMEVLEAASRFASVSIRTLELHFEERFPADELKAVLNALEDRRLIRVQASHRSNTVVVTSLGRHVVEEVSA